MINKIALQQHCLNIVAEKLKSTKEEMNLTKEASFEETKSSAGDKFETGREMMQQEADKFTRQIEELNKIYRLIDTLNLSKSSEKIEAGSIVKTNLNTFFISASLGMVDFQGEKLMLISAISPLASALLDKKAGEQITFNSRTYTIEEVY
ncbi:3-oxoacyl-ACP synthase [Peijinzhouia sedimentorum]